MMIAAGTRLASLRVRDLSIISKVCNWKQLPRFRTKASFGIPVMHSAAACAPDTAARYCRKVEGNSMARNTAACERDRLQALGGT